MSPILDVQRRYRQLGRIRAGEKGSKGEPRKLSKWRITTPSRTLAEAVAQTWGGEAQEWPDAPGGAQWQVYTDANELNVYVPPQDLDRAQYFELWSAGGVQRRCDGDTELISGRECMCNPEARKCQLTTHLIVILPQIPDLGVWRVTTHGWNAAAELPATVDLLRRIHEEGSLPAAVLGLAERSEIKAGQTRRFVVPELRLPWSLTEYPSAGLKALGHGGRPGLPGHAELPGDASFNGEESPGWGETPALPGEVALATRPQVEKLHALSNAFGWDEDERHRRAGVASFNELLKQAASELIEVWEATLSSAEPRDRGGEGSGTTEAKVTATAASDPSPPGDDDEPATPDQWSRAQAHGLKWPTICKAVQQMPGGEGVTKKIDVTKGQLAAVIEAHLAGAKA
jgi:hypothetical protein